MNVESQNVRNAFRLTQEAYRFADKGDFETACKRLVAAVNNLAIIVDNNVYSMRVHRESHEQAEKASVIGKKTW